MASLQFESNKRNALRSLNRLGCAVQIKIQGVEGFREQNIHSRNIATPLDPRSTNIHVLIMFVAMPKQFSGVAGTQKSRYIILLTGIFHPLLKVKPKTNKPLPHSYIYILYIHKSRAKESVYYNARDRKSIYRETIQVPGTIFFIAIRRKRVHRPTPSVRQTEHKTQPQILDQESFLPLVYTRIYFIVFIIIICILFAIVCVCAGCC